MNQENIKSRAALYNKKAYNRVKPVCLANTKYSKAVALNFSALLKQSYETAMDIKDCYQVRCDKAYNGFTANK